MTKLTVTTATPLTEEKRKEVEKAFAEKYRDFTVEYVVNDAIIGGMIVFDGEKVYNGSAVRQLDKMLERIKGKK